MTEKTANGRFDKLQGPIIESLDPIRIFQEQVDTSIGNFGICNITEPPYNADNTASVGFRGALQKAINDGHPAIRIPAGEYLLDQGSIYSNSVLINYFCGHPNLRIFGDGMGRTIIKTPDSVAWNEFTTIVQMKGGIFQRLHDITFQGARTTLSGDMSVVACASPFAEVFNCEFRHWANGPTGSVAGAGVITTGLPGGFWSLVVDTVIGSNITAGERIVTPDSMDGIYPGCFLDVYDAGYAGYETIAVKQVIDAFSFKADFVNNHTGPVTVNGFSEAKQHARLHHNYIHDCPRASGFITSSNDNELCFNRIFNVGSMDPIAGMHAFYDQGGYNNIHHNHIRGIGGIGYKAEKNVANVDASGSSVHHNIFEDCWGAFIYTTAGFENPNLPDDNMQDYMAIESAGSGYVTPPDVAMIGSAYGSGSILKAHIFNGKVVGVTVVKGGTGYDGSGGSSYDVDFSGGGGSGAAVRHDSANSIGYGSNRFSDISHNVFRRSTFRGYPPYTGRMSMPVNDGSAGLSGIVLGRHCGVNFSFNQLEDVANGTFLPYWITSGGGNRIIGNRLIQTENNSFSAQAMILEDRDVAIDNYIHFHKGSGIGIRDYCTVKGNQIFLLGEEGDTGAVFDLSPFGNNAIIADNYVVATSTSGIISTSGGPSNIDIHDNTFILLNGGRLIQGAGVGYDGKFHDNTIIGGMLVGGHGLSQLSLSENDMMVQGDNADIANAGTKVTPQAGLLGNFLIADSSTLVKNQLVKFDSSGNLVPVGTGDTNFVGISCSSVSTSTGNTLTAYIVDKFGAEYEIDCDGSWTAGHVGIISTTSAGKIHDNGTQTPPTYPNSYVIFLNTGGAAGLARVKLIRTL